MMGVSAAHVGSLLFRICALVSSEDGDDGFAVFNKLALCVVELRDVYLLALVCGDDVALSRDGEAWRRLCSARWSVVRSWAAEMCNSLVPPSALEALSSLSAARVYAVVWQLKRFVGGFPSCGDALLLLRSGSALPSQSPTLTLAAQDDDDALDRYEGVWLVKPASSSSADVRAWELFLSMGGMRGALETLAAVIAPAGAERDGRSSALNECHGNVHVTWFSSEDFEGLSGSCVSSVASLTPFELILWLSRYYQLLTVASGLSGVRRRSVVDSEWLGAATGHLRYAVQRVVSGWDSIARLFGFVNVEALIGPYVLWSAADSCYTVLNRPRDRGTLFSPVQQQYALLHGHPCPCDPVAVDVHAVARLPLADEQCRGVAAMFFSHLEQCTGLQSLGILIDSSGSGPTGVSLPAHALGRLSIRQYCAPVWRRSKSTVPPILRSVVAGLTAFPRVTVPSPVGGIGDGDGAAAAAMLSDSSLDEESDRSRRDASSRVVRGGGMGRRGDQSGGGGSGAGNKRSRSSSRRRATNASSSSRSGGERRGRRCSGSSGCMSSGSGQSKSSGSNGSAGRSVEDGSRERIRRRAVGTAAGRVGSRSLAQEKGRLPTEAMVAAAASVVSRGAEAGGTSSSSAPRQQQDAIIDLAMRSVARLFVCRASDLFSTYVAEEAVELGTRLLRADAARRSAGGADGDGGDAANHPELVLPGPWASLAGTVQLLLTDPPFNTRRLCRDPHSAYDVLSEEDAARFVQLCRVILRPGGHVLLHCSWEQVSMWVRLLRSAVDTFVAGSTGSRHAASFYVDSHPLHIVRAVYARTRGGRTNTALANKVDVIVGATRAGTSAAEAHVMVNYRTFNAVPSRFRAFENVIDNVPDVGRNEALRLDDNTGKFLRPEQKSVPLLRELILRYSQPGDLVVDPFGGTGSTAAAALSLPGGQHRRVIVSDADSVVMEAARVRLRRTFSEQLSMGAFAAALGCGLHACARAVAAELLAGGGGASGGGAGGSGSGSAFRSGGGCGPAHSGGVGPCLMRDADETSKRRMQRLSPPAGFPAHSALPRGVLHALANRFARQADALRASLGTAAHPRAPAAGQEVAVTLLQQAGKPLEEWPDDLRCALSTEDASSLRDELASSMGLIIAQSRTSGGAAGLGVFAGRDMAQGTEVAPFFGALMYRNFGALMLKGARYATDVLGSHAPSPAEYRARALRLTDVRVSAAAAPGAAPPGASSASLSSAATGGSSYEVWICPAPYCVAGFVNDARAVTAVERAVRAGARRGGRPRARAPESNVRIECAVEEGIVDVEMVVDPQFCRLLTTRAVEAGEELFLHYGSAYTFETSGGEAMSTTPHTFAAGGGDVSKS